jgi:hypothetical protein
MGLPSYPVKVSMSMGTAWLNNINLHVVGYSGLRYAVAQTSYYDSRFFTSSGNHVLPTSGEFQSNQ